jgi:hypothetical protein
VTDGDNIKLYSGENCATEIASATAAGTEITITPSSMNNGVYSHFGAKAIDPDLPAYYSSCISVAISYTLDSVASIPTGFSFSPSPENNSTPTLTVTGISSDIELIEIFTDSGCTTAIGSKEAPTNPEIISLPSLSQGFLALKVKVQDELGNVSSCATIGHTLNPLSNIEFSSSIMNNPSRLIDGNLKQGTTISYSYLPASLDFEFFDIYSIEAIVLSTDWWSKRPKSGEIQKWNGSSWETVKTFNIPSSGGTDLTCGDGTTTFGGVQCSASLYNNSFHEITGFNATTNKIRIVITETWWTGSGTFSIYNEIQFFGSYERPLAPTSLVLSSPSSSPGQVSTPTFTVSGGGVLSGRTVRLYTNSSCTTLVSSDNPSASTGMSVEVTTNALSDGTHTFYAKATDSQGNQSSCSTASTSYEKQSSQ